MDQSRALYFMKESEMQVRSGLPLDSYFLDILRRIETDTSLPCEVRLRASMAATRGGF
jgi:hypothetical protein